MVPLDPGTGSPRQVARFYARRPPCKPEPKNRGILPGKETHADGRAADDLDLAGAAGGAEELHAALGGGPAQQGWPRTARSRRATGKPARVDRGAQRPQGEVGVAPAECRYYFCLAFTLRLRLSASCLPRFALNSSTALRFSG